MTTVVIGQESKRSAAAGYNTSLGYLRAVMTALVVAHHAILAYHVYAPPPPATLLTEVRWWQAFPVVDQARSMFWTLVVTFDDVYFMSLMFFLSGLFVAASLRRKGGWGFVRDRAVRLGIPFVAAAAIVAPLACYPTFLQIGGKGGPAGYWRQWMALGNWPSGSAWFLWVLLAYGCVSVVWFQLWPRWGARLPQGAFKLFLSLGVISAVVYLPLMLLVSPMYWTSVGPFSVQTSRILHYLAYFLIAAGIGTKGLDEGALAPEGRLARHWIAWPVTALLVFAVHIGITLLMTGPRATALGWAIVYGLSWVASCLVSSFAALSLFLRFARRPSKVMDSLRDNAYGIYLVHYAYVSWAQLALLPVAMPGVVKAGVAFGGSLGLSWVTTAALRRIPVVRRVLG